MHKHLVQDELVYIEKGTVHVHLGDQEHNPHAGGTVLIPANTGVDIKNAGADTVSVVFLFQRLASRIACGATPCCQTKKSHLSR
jgi:quercetin dioxygenase-like cupin family protein